MPIYKITPEILKQVAARKAGKVLPFDTKQIQTLWMDWNRLNEPLNLEQLDLAVAWLNENGHNLLNLEKYFRGLDYDRQLQNLNDRTQYQNSIRGRFENWVDNIRRGNNDLANLGRFGLGVIDMPRKAMASAYNRYFKGNQDERYHPAKIADVMDNTPTPIAGVDYAQQHPFTSGIIDMISPGLLFGAMGGLKSAVGNTWNYARRTPVTGFEKTTALRNMQNGTVPKGVNYEVTSRAVPTTAKQSNNFSIEWSRSGGPKLTGTTATNGMRTRPYTKGSIVNGALVHGTQTTIPGTKIALDVETWNSVPFGTIPWLGIPQIVPPVTPNKTQPTQRLTIVRETPISVYDSDYIKWVIDNGGEVGDTIVMPDGRNVKYTPGPISKDSASLGYKYNFGLQEEWDKARQGRGTSDQPNVPSKTSLTSGKRPGIRVENRYNNPSVARDSSYNFPYIIR